MPLAAMKCSARFKESRLLFTFIIFATIGLFGWAIAPSILWLLVAMFPLAIGAGSFNAIINSAISKAVNPEEVGGILGFAAGLESSTRVVMPALASYLLGRYGPSTPGYMATVVMVLVVVFVYMRLIVTPDIVTTQ